MSIPSPLPSPNSSSIRRGKVAAGMDFCSMVTRRTQEDSEGFFAVSLQRGKCRVREGTCRCKGKGKGRLTKYKQGNPLKEGCLERVKSDEEEGTRLAIPYGKPQR